MPDDAVERMERDVWADVGQLCGAESPKTCSERRPSLSQLPPAGAELTEPTGTERSVKEE